MLLENSEGETYQEKLAAIELIEQFPPIKDSLFKG